MNKIQIRWPAKTGGAYRYFTLYDLKLRFGCSSNLRTKPSSFTYTKSTLLCAFIYKYLSVKHGFYSYLNHYVSHIAIILCFLPFLLVFWKKMSREKAYLLIGIYWLITGLINIPENWLGLAQDRVLQDNITLVDNLLDTPLMLLVFYFSYN